MPSPRRTWPRAATSWLRTTRYVRDFDRAHTTLDSSLATVRRLGAAQDLETASRIQAQNDLASDWFAKLPALASHFRYRAVVAVSDDHLQPTFDSMTSQLDRSGARHRAAALASLHESQRSEQVVLEATVITIALGLLLLTSAVTTLRYRDRLERIRHRELERLKLAALTDNLTTLGNHRAFEEELQRDLAEAAEAGRPLSLALLDLNGLKQTNDRFGHQAGDESIRALAQGLASAGPDTSAYRIGGDEFALVARGHRAIDTLYLVQHLQGRMAAQPADQAVTASAGVAEADAGIGRDELIRRADLALIQAKRSHRRCLLYNAALEPILQRPDAAEEQRHTDTLATALARAVDAKDAYTHSHCETVSELCAMIGQELGLPRERIARLRLAGLLHDVGKIGITDSILQKPGRLTDEEYRVMQTHTRLGHAIVSAAERPLEASWILHHHERVDGSGYPDGLRGDQIPLESRIILVADAFEAITADRPYRACRPAAAAMAELERCAGSQFDPDCVAALARATTPVELDRAA